ncbi:MAG: MmgE/PrpD family protein [Betaproteobacteria bacterium]|nr:MAG: MmgE/PrpD family protein [Betaproteobacteria bacterium]RPI41510.1 MAG: MmgE/PrpD family protein [Betaproteobacteria bacterium]
MLFFVNHARAASMDKTLISPLMQELSMYIATALHDPLPDAVSDRAKVHLVDTFAAMISGSRLLPGARAIEYVKSLGGKAEAGVMGTHIVTSPVHAALANGMFGHADETDDTHPPSLTHPGTSVVPAAMAIGESRGLNGLQVLRAIVLGYDLCSRMLLALRPMPFLRSGHHAGAFGQVFGAAAAACALLDLDARQVRYALSYTAQQAAGLYTMFRDPEHIEKAYAMGGMPAHNGTQAALMAANGFSGVEDVFSGERDFFFTFSPEADRGALVRGLGRDFEIMRGGIKRWPVGGPIQGPLHVLRELMRDHRFGAADVERIVARIPDKELEIVNNREMPDISIQHLLALMLVDGGITFASAHDFGRMKDPRVLEVRSRIDAVGDPALTDADRRWRCIMEVRLTDGRVLAHQTMAAKGSYENPLTPAEEEEKALDLVVPVLGKARSRELVAQLWNFEKLADAGALRSLYQP